MCIRSYVEREWDFRVGITGESTSSINISIHSNFNLNGNSKKAFKKKKKKKRKRKGNKNKKKKKKEKTATLQQYKAERLQQQQQQQPRLQRPLLFFSTEVLARSRLCTSQEALTITSSLRWGQRASPNVHPTRSKFRTRISTPKPEFEA